jgi:hypothetical protein
VFCRTKVAAMHFNENRMREQALDREGNKRFFQGFKKAKGGFTLQEVKEDLTFSKLFFLSLYHLSLSVDNNKTRVDLFFFF